MPKQKDLKRIVRSRMKRTGESYTAARLQILKKNRAHDYAEIAGMSDDAVRKQTGRGWAEWVKILDSAGSAEKPHRAIADYLSSLGTPDWWSQMVTVGYERIRGLRDIGQRHGGLYEASKSRTFPVSVAKLYKAFADVRTRARWLPGVSFKVRTAHPNKTMRLSWEDDTLVQLYFTSKGGRKSQVAVQHQKLPEKAAIERTRQFWSARFDALSELLADRR